MRACEFLNKPALLENSVSGKQVLSYIKKIHPKGEFTIDHSVMNHAEWELTQVPLSSLHIESDDVSPYDQINYIDYDHVADITLQDIKAKPIVVDNNGWIIDGNHRAVAARDMGLKSIPAYVPVESEDDEQETYDQHMARVNKERELSEVINVPTVSKGKREHLDVMPNDGRAIPRGKESDYMGEKVGRLGPVEVYTYNQGPLRTFVTFDPETRVSQLAVTGSRYPENPNSFIVKGVYSGPKNTVRASDLYAWLVRELGLTLISDKKQSPGGQRVWQELEQRHNRSVNVYAYNIRSNQPINTGTDDPESTHGTRGDIAQNVRLIAAPK